MLPISLVAAGLAGVFAFVYQMGWLDDMRSPLADSPAQVLWAWERPETMMFIDTQKTAVAFLVRRLRLTDDQKVKVVPRYQMLRVPEKTYLIAVVRIESAPHTSAAKATQAQRSKLISELLRAARISYVRELQVDFDARQDERQFYRQLLRELAQQMPSGVKLNITALASWCMFDRWATDLPVNETVGMFFRTGQDRRRVLTYLQRGGSVSSGRPTSVGVCTDELDMAVALKDNRGITPGSRLWLFSPQPWTEATYTRTVKELGI